ncbi:hypothetical protein ACTFIU_000771 [Dictyostelium citrinum]
MEVKQEILTPMEVEKTNGNVATPTPAITATTTTLMDDDLFDDEASPPQPNNTKKLKVENGAINKPASKAASPVTSKPTPVNGKKPTPKKKEADSSDSDSSSSDSDSSDSDSSDSDSDSSSSDSDAPKKKPSSKLPPKKPSSVVSKPSKNSPKITTTTTTTSSSITTIKAKPAPKVKAESSSGSDSSGSDSSGSDSSGSDSSSDDSSEEEKPKKKPSKKPAAVKKEVTVKKETTTTTKKTPVKKEVAVKKETKITTKKASVKKEESDSDSGEKTTTKKKTTTTTRKRKLKDEEDEDEDEEDEGVNDWWNKEDDEDDGTKWTTLIHNGPVFPPAYVPHGVKFMYDGKVVKLTPKQEEVATFYANYLETDHVKKEAFRDNFFREFKGLLTPQQKEIIKNMEKCDFSHIHTHLKTKKEQRKARTKEEKEAEAAEKKKIQEKHGFATIDGFKEKVGNYMIEPPGLFLGRGQHPKTGMLKQRIMPSDVTLNIGKGEAIPPSPIPGEKWKEIVHNNTVTWLAFWRESVNGGFKYVWLAPSSKIKGQADRKKFEVARGLKNCIGDIRKGYQKSFNDESDEKRQLAVALYLIDFLALRVGNEKGEDQADTVGCCSLRVEHIKLEDDNTITLDFLGKDSMRYLNTVKIREDAYKVLKTFVNGKKPGDLLFDSLTVTQLNNHLKKQMTGLSAKVFRTYNASITLQKELDKMDPNEFQTIDEKILFYNRCNREVAILCNHQKAPPKNLAETMSKIDEKIQELRDLQDLCRIKIDKAPISKPEDIKKREAERLPKLIQLAITNKKEKDKDKTDKEISFDVKAAFEKSRTFPDSKEKLKEKIAKYEDQIKKQEILKTGKDELKTVALGTSKINYLDPRITVAWCKKNKVPVDKIFTKSLRDKFPWSDVGTDFIF